MGLKVIFLDYDGVLNRIDPMGGYCTPARTINGHFTQAEPELVYMFNLMVDKTGAEIVLSSTWRISPDWRESMRESGIIKPILDRTPVIKHKGHCRGDEIEEWLNEHPEVERYIILDDDTDMLPEQMENFFKTDTKLGLTQEIALLAERHLLSPPFHVSE